MKSCNGSLSGRQPVEVAANQRCVREFFEQQAESYSAFFDSETLSGAAVLFQLRRRLTIELLSGEKPRALLDIATGTGEITYAVAATFEFDDLLLNDISPGMVRSCQRVFNARSLAGNITWTNEDAFELLARQPPDRFDIILCLGLIAHTGRLQELLADIFTCLRPGGVLIVQSSLTDHLGVWITTLYARSPFRRMRHKVRAFSREEIVGAAAAAGFEFAEMRRYGFCLPFGDRILGRLNHRLEAAYAERLRKRGGDALFKFRRPV